MWCVKACVGRSVPVRRCALRCIVLVRESKIIFLLSKTELLCSESANLVVTINKGAFYCTQLHCLLFESAASSYIFIFCSICCFDKDLKIM